MATLSTSLSLVSTLPIGSRPGRLLFRPPASMAVVVISGMVPSSLATGLSFWPRISTMISAVSVSGVGFTPSLMV
ncbi:hypothetical protein D3C76_1648630 [compost metagenome]